jgi:hypothetical protein
MLFHSRNSHTTKGSSENRMLSSPIITATTLHVLSMCRQHPTCCTHMNLFHSYFNPTNPFYNWGSWSFEGGRWLAQLVSNRVSFSPRQSGPRFWAQIATWTWFYQSSLKSQHWFLSSSWAQSPHYLYSTHSKALWYPEWYFIGHICVGRGRHFRVGVECTAQVKKPNLGSSPTLCLIDM